MSKWKEMHEAENTAEIAGEVVPDNEPIGMEEVEQTLKEDYDEVLEAFKARREKENKRFREVVDTNHYMVICFTTNEQMVEFCNNFGIDIKYRYYDGRDIAKAFKKALKSSDMTVPRERGRVKEYGELAIPPKKSK